MSDQLLAVSFIFAKKLAVICDKAQRIANEANFCFLNERTTRLVVVLSGSMFMIY
jgi:hypothetical protein